MVRARIASVLGLLIGLALGGALPCRAADDNPNWGRPMSLGVSPALAIDAGADERRDAPAHVDEIKIDKARTLLVTTTGARLEWGRFSIVLSQRLPVERELLVIRGLGASIQSVEQIDDATCQIHSGYATLTMQANSTLIIKAKQAISIDLLALFNAGYQAQQRGGLLAVDARGGFGVFASDDEAFVGQSRPFCEFWYRLAPGQELWISLFPQRPAPEPGAVAALAASNAAWTKKSFPPGVPMPDEKVLRVANVAGFFHHASMQKEIRSSQRIMGVLYRHGGTIDFGQVSPSKAPLPVTLKWDAPGWKVEPTEATLSPATESMAKAVFAFAPVDAAQARPAPRLLATYALPGLDGQVMSQTQVFAAAVNETTDVPRLPALAGLDALVEALKDQPPRIIRSEGDEFVETRRAPGASALEPERRLAPGPGDRWAQIRLAIAGDSLAIHARVMDPRCLPETASWSGGGFGIAGVDLYVSGAAGQPVRQFHFRALSPAGDKTIVFNENGLKVGDATFPCRIVAIKPMGYEVHALIPLKDCLIDPAAERFLFDAAMLLKDQFRLLYTGDPTRCAYRNNRYFGMAIVQLARRSSSAP